MSIMHSCRNDDWMTPGWILEKVREVLGTIDLDPASSEDANSRVKAAGYYGYASEDDHGLTHKWGFKDHPYTVFCNPPGGKQKGKSLTALFWQKLMKERDQGHIFHAIFLCFSAEALQNTQGKGVRPVGTFPFCVPAKRIQFDYPGPLIKKSPSNSNVIAYVPGTIDRTALFSVVFSDVGVICNKR